MRKPGTAAERMRAMASLASGLADCIANTADGDRDRSIADLRSRYTRMFNLSAETFDEHTGSAVAETMDFARIVGLKLSQTELGGTLQRFAKARSQTTRTVESVVGQDTLDHTQLPDPDAPTSARSDAQDILAAGIQDISNSMVEDFRLNDILRMILETIYRAMGFERVIFCLRNPQRHTMQGRFGYGPDAGELAQSFNIGLDFTPDIFHASLNKGADILISNVADPAIQSRIPAWFRSATRAQTFVLLPLVIRQAPVALIYAEKSAADSIHMGERELALLRTLRNQAVLAIRSSG